MKPTIMFVFMIVIGAIGGVLAGEVKDFFKDTETVVNTETNSSSAVLDLNEDLSAEIADLKKMVKDNVRRMNEISKTLDGVNSESPTMMPEPSKDEWANTDYQRQINELRGIVKGIQQKMGTMVEDQVTKYATEKEAADKAKMQEQMKKFVEDSHKHQLKNADKHAEKMRKELGLSDSQFQSIKAALIEKADKTHEIMSNMNVDGSSSPMDLSTKLEKIQKEWEDTAKSTLDPNQYDNFMKKKLNRVGSMFFSTAIVDGEGPVEIK